MGFYLNLIFKNIFKPCVNFCYSSQICMMSRYSAENYDWLLNNYYIDVMYHYSDTWQKCLISQCCCLHVCIRVNTLPGSKLKLIGKVTICNGYLLLYKANCKLLGGCVQSLVDSWNLKMVSLSSVFSLYFVLIMCVCLLWLLSW